MLNDNITASRLIKTNKQERQQGNYYTNELHGLRMPTFRADEKNTDSCREKLRISKEPNKISLYEKKKKKDLNGYNLELEQITNFTIIKKKRESSLRCTTRNAPNRT